MIREEFIGKVILWFVVSFLIGVVLASFRYPFFIEGSSSAWELKNPTAVEGNLLVIASLLIGVAIVQAQNLNRMLDIRRTTPEEKKRPGSAMAEVYDYLRTGFWLLSVDVLVVMALLTLAIFFGTKLSDAQAFILATFWWSGMALIVASWICLAIVAGRSYRD
jgi:hypothetical protein